ncbi:MAG: hypothetical protein DLM72_07285 [Candidatus Nitrosopolaris wilkensis]|nr:MAG: hypothetical protein DLM72_07285 [Candidatus Nitrosopolaris wilkensis]
MDTIESIRNAKRKAAELADTALSLVNSKEIETASSYYLKALEEVGRIKILQDNPRDGIAKIEGAFVADADYVMQEARDSRIHAALAYLVRENDVSFVVKNGTQLVIRKDVSGNELKRALVSLKTKLAFL